MPPSEEMPFLWAKREETTSGVVYHPLICHLIDVAEVTRLMWSEIVSPAARESISTSLGIDETSTEGWLALWAGLHDIGKASPTFQQQLSFAKLPHGTISSLAISEILTRGPFGLSSTLSHQLAVVIGGHHGVFPRGLEISQARQNKDAIGRAQWTQMRAEIAQKLTTVLGLPQQQPSGVLNNASAMWIAGLISISDWIGSDNHYFPYEDITSIISSNSDLADYRQRASRQARHALRELGWLSSPGTPCQGSFRDLFDGMEPRPLQEKAIAIAPQLGGPGLVIIEAPMGEGKTEAALYLADYGNSAYGLRGHYFALPTQATSNQMFGRVRAFLSHRYPYDVIQMQLLHGHSALSAEFDVLKANGRVLTPTQIDEVDGWDGSPAGVVAGEWFTFRKRGLLAPFGVGTIDQALLAVLQTRHVFVRLFGLAYKTIVIDEVHAYDTYMSTLLDRLLSWLGALGSSVVLLSATLPNSRRARLVQAYADGRGLPERSTPPPNVVYPRLTWISAAGHDAHSIETSAQSRKTVALSWFDSSNSFHDLGSRLYQALANGGCAAVMCNTVAHAQAMYRALQPFFAPDELDLLHARFLYEDREHREHRALSRFGKPGGDGVSRPWRSVLVATQIIEQSLDLDFDLMVTELAPVDLVLQRSGRLHRHERVRPNGLEHPQLWVLAPPASDGCPTFEVATTYVYDEHILLRSWLELRKHTQIIVPDEIERLIEAVYGDHHCPDTATPNLHTKWNETAEKSTRERERNESIAKANRLLAPTYSETEFLEDANRQLEENNPEVHASLQALTRLGDPTVQLICLTPLQARASDPGKRPSLAETKSLLMRSVSISHRGVVHQLLEQAAPAGWVTSPLLRHYRMIELDDQSQTIIGSYLFAVDSDLGVVVTKVKRDDQE